MSQYLHVPFAVALVIEGHHFVLPTGGGGAITLTRDRRGDITVSYRIPSGDADAALEGKVRVEGEDSIALVRDFEAFLQH